MRFSQRIGKRSVKAELIKDELDADLRNSLWSLILELTIGEKSESPPPVGTPYSPKSAFFRAVWIHFYKWPIDNLEMGYSQVEYYRAVNRIRDWYYKADWDLAFDFVEFCVNYDDNKYADTFNSFLKKEMSAYRFVNGSLAEVNSEEEIIEIEEALANTDKFKSVKTHLNRAIELYADKKNPDYRNSIKESISAVESLAKIIIGDNKTTLGQALSIIEKKHEIPGSLKSAFSALYGYTSGEGGIRHSLLETNTSVNMEEARFMLIACSAFVNYLISKL